MAVKITGIEKTSVAQQIGLCAGCSIISVDGNEINDMLDYEFYTAKPNLTLAIYKNDRLEYIEVKKEEYQPLGCDFATYLIDKKHSCKNKCMFCFIDQLPKGMRESLYFKDDDERLSFLYGNYITLTNLTQHEVERIKKMHISPVNISVHTTNPQLRVQMMTNKNAGAVLKYLDDFAQAGIKINAQIVLCPGVNDGEELRKTLKKLTSLYPQIQSIAAVPFGMTDYREGLYPLQPYDKQSATEVLDILQEFGDMCDQKFATRLVYPADELFLLSEKEIPADDYYEDYAQLENGVGMYRRFLDSFAQSITQPRLTIFKRNVDVATGEQAYPLIKKSAQQIMEKYKNTVVTVHCIKNNFFGGNVGVAGLICGCDIIAQLKDKIKSKRLIITESMLRDEEDCFLDDVTVKQVEAALGVKIFVSPQTGNGFTETVFKNKRN